MLGLNIAYLRTKFDDCSFRRSRDMVDAYQNLNSSRDLTMPWWLAFTTINLSTKF